MTVVVEGGIDTPDIVVRDCIDHLFALIAPGGKFVYAHEHLNVSKTYSGYNLLRHCGTVWFMSKAIRLMNLPLSSANADLLEATVAYIRAKLKRPDWASSSFPTLCLTSKDAVKLGGVGLAILMIQEYGQLLRSRGMTCAPTLFPEGDDVVCAQLENYVESQSVGDDFLHKRVFSTGTILPFQSDYYTGEALFALTRSPMRRPEVSRTMEMLLDRGYGLNVQSHWMAYAACAAARNGFADPLKAFRYLEGLAGSIIADQAYRARHESTPIACRSEALVEILLLHHDLPVARENISSSLIEKARETLAQNLSLQLRYYGDGQFRKGRQSDKVQIDYIQHNASAFLGWTQLGGVAAYDLLPI